jgi:hypothetical protein
VSAQPASKIVVEVETVLRTLIHSSECGDLAAFEACFARGERSAARTARALFERPGSDRHEVDVLDVRQCGADAAAGWCAWTSHFALEPRRHGFLSIELRAEAGAWRIVSIRATDTSADAPAVRCGEFDLSD